MTDRYANIRRALEMGPTPGPWRVVNGSDVFTRLGARNAAGVKAADNDGWYIADCDMGPSFTGEGEADIPYAGKRANARLIAACDPDTLRALLAERDALARDAERYRWLREQTPCTIRLDGNLRALGLPDGVAPAYLQADTADALDTQIDAAIAAENGGAQ